MTARADPTAKAAPVDYRNPPLKCDVVMKGGITSGVVYPGAVLELAKRYRFCSIGGASAGAIAAGVVAAAEFAPDRNDGFAAVAELPKTLAREGFMLRMFAPDRDTRPLFEAGVGFLRWRKPRALLNVARRFWRFPLLGLTVLVASILLGVLADARGAFVVGGAAVGVAIALAGLAIDLARAVAALGHNDFGICHLGPDAGTQSEPALTGWLYGLLQEISGKDPAAPLTFADLWGVTGEGDRAAQIAAFSRDPKMRKIDLQMMTTNLSEGRPMRVPVPVDLHADELEEGNDLHFDPEELGRFFPCEVIQHLKTAGGPIDPDVAAELPPAVPAARLYRFPIGAELPVVVGVRMSLSFPVLIAALPLWEVDAGADAGPRARRVVFSDGGITSNFPVHFFDGPMPTRPTFGLQLTGFEAGDGPRDDDACHSVGDPPAVDGPATMPWVEIEGLRGFFGAVKDSMQNWRDNAQSQLPGFRERIVQIRLAPKEGGLNLTMKSKKIEDLGDRGACAGKRLVELFSGDPDAPPVKTDHWNDHRFARYRVTMSVVEGYLRAFRRGYDADADAATTPYPERIAAGATQEPFMFESPGLAAYAERTTDTYLDLVEICEGLRTGICEEPPVPRPPVTLDDANVPRPRSVLRAVPPT